MRPALLTRPAAFFWEALEAEPRAQCGGASSQSSCDGPEVPVGNIVRNPARIHVQVVEHVIDIKSNFKPCTFTEARDRRQAEPLGQRQIQVSVSGEIERIAMYAGRLRQCRAGTSARERRIRGRREISGTAVGEVRLVDRFEGIVAGAGTRTACIARWVQSAVPALTAIKAAPLNTD